MTYKQHIKSLNNFTKTYELEHCSLTFQIETPKNCSCGYPHGYIYISSHDCGHETLINDFSLSDKESYFNVTSIVQLLTQADDFYDNLQNDMEKFQKSLAESN
jgi:hypothetical protein